ncbi:MAG: class I SAM-dependent methyltransferase [Gammaproteobacteria bacterium]
MAKTAKPRRARSMAQKADRQVYYQRSVQCAESEIDFVDDVYRKLRRRRAVTLREDFCGTALVCCEWVNRRPGNIAFGVDLDPEVQDWGRKHNVSALKPSAQARLSLINDNVLTVRTRPVDMILAMNFSYWIFKTRKLMLEYFRRVRAGLAADGIFFLDAMGGYDAFRVLKERTKHRGFTYIWNQAEYNPITGDYLCHIEFTFPDGSRLPKAFTYDWRLWTLPELREILLEAGFRKVTVYWDEWDEKKQKSTGEYVPMEKGEADAGWIAYIAAEK